MDININNKSLKINKMINKTKNQMNRYLRNYQDTSAFSLSQLKELRSIFAFDSFEPEPLFINGQYLYV